VGLLLEEIHEQASETPGTASTKSEQRIICSNPPYLPAQVETGKTAIKTIKRNDVTPNRYD
jgi:hypothetical protein